LSIACEARHIPDRRIRHCVPTSYDSYERNFMLKGVDPTDNESTASSLSSLFSVSPREPFCFARAFPAHQLDFVHSLFSGPGGRPLVYSVFVFVIYFRSNASTFHFKGRHPIISGALLFAKSMTSSRQPRQLKILNPAICACWSNRGKRFARDIGIGAYSLIAHMTRPGIEMCR
jgi:hypothetical protein